MGIPLKAKTAKPSRVLLNPNRLRIVDPCEHELGLPRERNGIFAHYCYEWDEMLIDETDPEFATCLCGCPNPKT